MEQLEGVHSLKRQMLCRLSYRPVDDLRGILHSISFKTPATLQLLLAIQSCAPRRPRLVTHSPGSLHRCRPPGLRNYAGAPLARFRLYRTSARAWQMSAAAQEYFRAGRPRSAVSRLALGQTGYFSRSPCAQSRKNRGLELVYRVGCWELFSLTSQIEHEYHNSFDINLQLATKIGQPVGN